MKKIFNPIVPPFDTVVESLADLTTKDHDLLSGLSDDDHTQYLLANGTRAMTGDLDMSSYDIIFKHGGTHAIRLYHAEEINPSYQRYLALESSGTFANLLLDTLWADTVTVGGINRIGGTGSVGFPTAFTYYFVGTGGKIEFAPFSTTLSTNETTGEIEYKNWFGTKLYTGSPYDHKALYSGRDNSDDLGKTTLRWRDLYIAGSLKNDTYSLTVANLKTAYDHSQAKHYPPQLAHGGF